MRNLRRLKQAIEKTVEEEVDANRVFPNRWNFNEQTSIVFHGIVESIRRYGNRLYPVIVRDVGRNRLEIVDGEHRWKACCRLGLQKVFVKNLGKIDDGTAEELMLLLNENRGESDLLKLAKLVDEIKNEFGEEDVKNRYPFTEAELRDLELFKNVDWNAFPEEWEGRRRPTLTRVQRCEHEWEEVEVWKCDGCGLVRTTPPEPDNDVDKETPA